MQNLSKLRSVGKAALTVPVHLRGLGVLRALPGRLVCDVQRRCRGRSPPSVDRCPFCSCAGEHPGRCRRRVSDETGVGGYHCVAD